MPALCGLNFFFTSFLLYSLVHMIPRWPRGGSQLRSIKMSGHYLTFVTSETIVLIYSLDVVLCYLVERWGHRHDG